jgi:hypothetical protein
MYQVFLYLSFVAFRFSDAVSEFFLILGVLSTHTRKRLFYSWFDDCETTNVKEFVFTIFYYACCLAIPPV